MYGHWCVCVNNHMCQVKTVKPCSIKKTLPFCNASTKLLVTFETCVLTFRLLVQVLGDDR